MWLFAQSRVCKSPVVMVIMVLTVNYSELALAFACSRARGGSAFLHLEGGESGLRAKDCRIAEMCQHHIVGFKDLATPLQRVGTLIV